MTNKYFFINIPLKDKNINNKIEILFNCIISLNKKVSDLENQIKNSKNENKKNLEEYENKNKEIEKKFNAKIEILQNQINDLKKNKESITNDISQNKIFQNSSIIKADEVDLILSWLEKKPKNISLLLDSKIDGDLNSTFYEKCKNKSPTMVFVKTTENLRFGGFTSVSWPKSGFIWDDSSFLFSLDKRKKYIIKQKDKAIYYSGYSFCFGSKCDLYIRDQCTKGANIVGNGSYDVPSECELNNGKKNFFVSNYEVYHIEYK